MKARLSASTRFKLEAPWLILIALMLGTFTATYQSYERGKLEAQARFIEKARAAQQNLVGEFHNSEDLLRSASALVIALPKIEPRQWNNFFEAHSVSGFSVRGLVRVIYKSADPVNPVLLTHDFESLADNKLYADIEQHPSVATAILLAEKTRKLTTAESAQTNNDKSNQSALVALILPVYATNSPTGQALNLAGEGKAKTIAHEATKLSPTLGYLIALVRPDDVVANVSANFGHHLSLTLLSGNQILHSDLKPTAPYTAAFSEDMTINPGQRQWILRVDSTPMLERELATDTPRAIFLVGILGTLLLTGLIWLLTRLRDQAEALAARITEKLQDQVKFTEDLIEFNPNPIFRKDAEGRFTVVNRAWEQLSGRSRMDVLGRTNHDFQPPEIALQSDLADKELYASAEGYEANEAFISNVDGHKFETIISKQVLHRADGTIDGLIGTITDITPKKKLEKDLAQQREQLDLVIRSAQQGIWDVELKPGGHRYFSERFFEMLGYSPKHPLGDTNWREQLHSDDVKNFARELVRHFKRETPYFDTEARVLKQNGEYIWVRVRAVAQHDEKGRAIRFVGSIGDITESKAVEAAMRDANVRVMEAARAKEAFLATMSHEIRTPLNGVLGMAGLLSETTLNSEQRDYIRLIHASGDTLLRLIDDVLDFSKIESGRMTLETVPVEIITLVEEAFELVAEKAREKQLALIYDIREDVPFYILGDATRLRQILLNMLSNAIKFTERGEIKLTMVAKRTVDGKLEIEGRVSDTGIGIPAERLSKLFQPFTQADASTTRKYGGTGLGLAIIRRLTQLMRGDVRIESTEGEGTTFIFTFASQAARGPLSPYMQRDVLDFVGKRLLLVESCRTRHPGMHHFLTYWGFQTTVVFPENAAAALLADPLTDIIMSDLVLPSQHGDALQRVMTDMDAARAANHQPPLASILLSNFSRLDLHQRGVLPPIRHDVFLLRPCGKPKMFDALLRAVLREFSADAGSRPFKRQQADAATFVEKKQPINTNTSKQTTGKLPAKSNVHIFNILVAEDNEINQRVIGGILKNLHQRVTLVENGRLAVQAALGHDFDIILMDIHMPELDGTSAMHEIRSHFVGHHCPPIVAMTAHAMAGDRERYLESGMDDYLSKPIRTADVVGLLERIYDRQVTSSDEWPNKNEVPDTAAKLPVDPYQATSHTSSTSLRTDVTPTITISKIETIPVLDKEQLEDLRYLPAVPGDITTKSDTDPVNGLINLFQSKAIERINNMKDCLATQDWKQLADTAHSLRGASASVGFPRVATLCKDMELGARQLCSNQDDVDLLPLQVTLDEIFELIRHHYREADNALIQWLTVDSDH